MNATLPWRENRNMDEKQVKEQKIRQNFFNPRFMSAFADEVAKLVIARLPKRKAKPKAALKKDAVGSLFLDTSAIIDGRILDAMLLGFSPKYITLIEGVLFELKHLADSKDAMKKLRAKSALDLLSKVKREKKIHIIHLDDKFQGLPKEVDEQILVLAKKYRGDVATGDFNLEKKASVSGVRAINVHALASVFKIRAVPGEQLNITIAHPGKEEHQGVGYLADGTMVVVERAADDLDKNINIKVARVIQTVSGRILFAKKEAVNK
jgi:uncharacterized protein YacL